MSGQLAILIISGIISFLIISSAYRSIYHDETLIQSSRDRLYRAYAPLFQIVEPNLYKEITNRGAAEISAALLKVVEQERVFISPVLCNKIETFAAKAQKSNMLSYKDYEEICRYIEQDYEELKGILKLPRRHLMYRLQYEERPRITVWIPEIIKYAFFIAGAMLIFFVVRLCLVGIGEQIAKLITIVSDFI